MKRTWWQYLDIAWQYACGRKSDYDVIEVGGRTMLRKEFRELSFDESMYLCCLSDMEDRKNGKYGMLWEDRKKVREEWERLQEKIFSAWDEIAYMTPDRGKLIRFKEGVTREQAVRVRKYVESVQEKLQELTAALKPINKDIAEMQSKLMLSAWNQRQQRLRWLSEGQTVGKWDTLRLHLDKPNLTFEEFQKIC